MKKKSRSARLLAGITAVAMLLPQMAFANAGTDSIDKYLGPPTTAAQKAEFIVNQYGATSMQYALIDDGEIVVSGHNGVYSRSEDKALTKDTMYGIGSVSKTFTAAVIMKLVEDGRVELDKPVTTYLPAFRMADSRYKDITVRMLLNHSSGLMGTNYKNAFLFDDTDTSAHDELLNHLSKQNLKADPGAFSVYCNDGFTLAELVAEKVTGRTFTQLIGDYIAKPLAMSSTKTPQDTFDRDRLAKTYWPAFQQELPVDSVGIIGTGGIYSTAEDMCRFAQIFMQGDGKEPNTSVLSRSSAEQMAQPEYARGIWPDKNSPQADGYGMGWDSVSGAAFAQYGIQEVVKGGDTFFYHASLVVLPEKNMAAVVLSSGGASPYIQLVAEKLLEERLAAKGELKVSSGTAESKETESTGDGVATPGTQPMPTELMDFGGYYNAKGIMKVDVAKDGKMAITVPGNDEYVESYTYEPGSAETAEGAYFTDEMKLVQVSFVKESNGEVYLKLKGPSVFMGLGVIPNNYYTAQKISDVKVSQEAIDGWKAREGKMYYGIDEKYTSSMYLQIAPIYKIALTDELPGYAFGNIMSSPNDTKTVLQIPGSAGRDLSELHMYTKDGVEYMTTYGDMAISGDAVRDIDSKDEDGNIRTAYEIGKDGYAVWLTAGETAGRAVTVTPPTNGAFFLYDAAGTCLNASLVTGVNTVVIPEGGTLCMAGDPGATFQVALEPFSDAVPGDWYYDAVTYVTEKNLTSGTAPYRFGPEDQMSRAMLVTMLNKMGQTDQDKYGLKPENPVSFADVTKEAWYADAVAWAGGAGIVTGAGKDKDGGSLFAPEEDVTREQLVVILYQFAQKLGWETPSEGMAIREFSDAEQVGGWAQEAMRWAVGQGLISGKPGQRLDPQGTASRAETAVILMKFMKSAEK